MLRRIRRAGGDIFSRLTAAYGAAKRHTQYDRLARAGVSPFVHISPLGPMSQGVARTWMARGHLLVPNVSGFYHGILQTYWERHGLGSKCLLVSETKAVAQVFAAKWPRVKFVSTDYYLELQPNPACDVVWDLCSPKVPGDLHGFDSVVCQATLEHVRDPVQVMRNLSTVLNDGGTLYVQTHTPAFRYHAYPKDYLRYFPEWFTDIGETVGALELLELLCVDGHAFAAYRKRVEGGGRSTHEDVDTVTG